MAEKDSKEFSESRIVISTLLPRTDTPPHVIHDTNMEISRGCATLPNVKVAHHPTIGIWDLHDGVHLNRQRVRVLQRTSNILPWDATFPSPQSMGTQEANLNSLPLTMSGPPAKL